MKVVVVSGGFDPLHSGHIKYFKSAKKLGDHLIVALNSDDWLSRKKGKSFMPFSERYEILSNLSMVDSVIGFKDDSLGSCKDALEQIKANYIDSEIIFCNGGDRNQANIPEMAVKNINFKFGVGGTAKKNSSSWILKEFAYESEERVWGKFFNLYHEGNVKVKELIILPKKGISLQKHLHRSEIWFVKKGHCTVRTSSSSAKNLKKTELKSEDKFIINKGDWHQLYNLHDDPCSIIEIQYGEYLDESDIERHSFFDLEQF